MKECYDLNCKCKVKKRAKSHFSTQTKDILLCKCRYLYSSKSMYSFARSLLNCNIMFGFVPFLQKVRDQSLDIRGRFIVRWGNIVTILHCTFHSNIDTNINWSDLLE